MIRVYNNSKIFILCPAAASSGGPESLHNLAAKLRLFGHDARIVYVRGNKTYVNKKRNTFQCYDIRTSDHVEDRGENILIVPEIWTYMLDRYVNVQKAVWWLSVDNYCEHDNSHDFMNPENREVIHFAQGRYVTEFLLKKGANNIRKLNSSINRDFCGRSIPAVREDIAIYNPRKGLDLISRLMERPSSVKWVPVINMKREEIVRLMRRSKVYVDFGHFPGTDRMPRESVASGCCVIVGLKGAARCSEDVPIPGKYKFPTDPFDGNRIMDTIEDCVVNYNKRKKNFKQWRNITRQGEKRFEAEIRNIFGRKRNLIAINMDKIKDNAYRLTGPQKQTYSNR